MKLNHLFAVVVALFFLLPGCQSPLRQVQPATWQGQGEFNRHLAATTHHRVYFGGQPTSEVLAEARENGVTTIINIRTPGEMAPDSIGFDEAALANDNGLTYVTIPVSPATLSEADAEALAEVLESTPSGESIILHCGSSNRVGALWALYLNKYEGFAIDAAIVQGQAAGLRSDELEAKVREIAGE